MVGTELLHCFVDTNTLIHFTTFDEVDWPTELDTAAVRLMIVPTVLRELDRFKDDVTKEWRRDRVRKILPKIVDLLEQSPPGQPAQVRDGVTLYAIPAEPALDWQQHDLDREVADDRIIASVLSYQQSNPTEAVVFVSRDSGPRLKARARGITALNPAKFLDPVEASSSKDKELQRLRSELAEIKARKPDIRLGFKEGAGLQDHIALLQPQAEQRWISDDEIRKSLDLERRACLAVVDPRLESLARKKHRGYVVAVEDYLDDLRFYLESERFCYAGRVLTLRLALENQGKAPATDVEVRISVPKPLIAMTEDDRVDKIQRFEKRSRPERPAVPDLPNPAWMDGILGNTERFANRSPYLVPGFMNEPNIAAYPGITAPYTTVEYNVVELGHPKLRAGERWVSEAVTLTMPPTEVTGFELTYTMHADELTERGEGVLRIRLVPNG